MCAHIIFFIAFVWPGHLKTSDHTVFEFNRTHSATSDLQVLRQTLHRREMDLSFVRTSVERHGKTWQS